MNWRPAVGLLLGGVIVGWAVSKGCSREASGPDLVQLPSSEVQVEVAPESGNPQNPTEIKPGQQPNGRVLLPMKEASAPTKPEMPFEYKKELELFADIKKRLFLSEAELAEKNKLLNDTALLRALGLRLTEPSASASVVESQDVAVDLLVEALKSGDRDTASEVMKSVVEDPQVENPGLDKAVRENMAGIKAEVLLRWAALAPDHAAQIERSLPGPVSKKIWENVKKRHDSNKADQ